MAISLPGLPSGNYRVYINGKPGKAFMVSPWSYPLYRIDNSSVIEVVIEVSNTSEILNICPRLTSLGLTMTYFDTYKNSFYHPVIHFVRHLCDFAVFHFQH